MAMASGTIKDFHKSPTWDLNWEIDYTDTTITVRLYCYPDKTGYYGYNLSVGAKVSENGSQAWSKPITGRASINYTCTLTRNTGGNSTVLFMLKCTDHGCDNNGWNDGNGISRGSYTIPPSYTIPNISISSINGVPVAEGAGNYSIIINANQDITIGYTGWLFHSSEDECSIDAWVTPFDRSRNISWKSVYAPSKNGVNAGTVSYRSHNNPGESSSLMGSGVTFDYDGQYLWLWIQRYHTKTGVTSPSVDHFNVRLIKVLYTPIDAVNITRQPSSLITNKQDITISWQYPGYSSLINQNGIVSGYEIRLVRRSNGAVEFTTSTAYNSYTLSKNNYKALREYYIQIIPYYQVDANRRSYGPVRNTNIFMAVSDLPAPTISYPKTTSGCVWVGSNIYVLAQLPTDPDYNDLENEDGYFYKDIEVSINNVTYKYSTNKSQFSISNLPYTAKFVFTTKGTNLTFSNTYTIKVRVQKNYGNSKWSNYTTITLSAVSMPTAPLYSGYIMATDFIPLYNYVSRMRNCYKPSGVSLNLNNVAKGNYILRDDFQKLYNELLNISDLIDTWGDFSNQSIKVKFENVKFNPLIEYITDIDNDTNPQGHNYFIQAYNWIRHYKI